MHAREHGRIAQPLGDRQRLVHLHARVAGLAECLDGHRPGDAHAGEQRVVAGAVAASSATSKCASASR